MVFRRGPARRVLLIDWDLRSDTFRQGQWLKGRIYERRCDLSPDGDFLLYFAAKYKGPVWAWTAISRPPFLTALALWPKDETYGGGGQFIDRNRIALNHGDDDMKLADGFRLPERLTVTQLGPWAGGGEDEPAWSMRLERDGWTRVSEGRVVNIDRHAPIEYTLDPPMIWEKRHPIAPDRYILSMALRGVKEQNGPFYVTDHAVGETQLPRTSWADWDHNGDLLFARDSRLYRMDPATAQAREIADFAAAAFRELEPSAEALTW